MTDLARTLGRYPQIGRVNRAVAVAGGFSGAEVYRVESERGTYCLRRWPAETLPAERIAGLHRLLAHVAAEGCDFVAVPLRSDSGSTLLDIGDRLWQLEPWLPGAADFHRERSESRLRSAMTALARWHRAAARFVPSAAIDARWFGSIPSDPSPAVVERLERLRGWNEQRLKRIMKTAEQRLRAAASNTTERLSSLAASIGSSFRRLRDAIARELQTASTICVPLQPCLRDVWHDHVLFDADEVTGIIDPSAVRTESVAADLARLLGSFLGDDVPGWNVALEEYRSHRPLSLAEIGLTPILDRSGVVLAGVYWLERIALGEVSEPLDRVVSRMETVAMRMQNCRE